MNIALRSVNDEFDDSPDGKLTENILSSFAQYDNDLRSERAKNGIRKRLLQGGWPFRPPVGYVRDSDGGGVLHDPIMGPLVRLAFELVASGARTMTEALSEVSDLGLRSSAGARLSAQSFGKMLRNPFYMGDVVSPRLGIRTLGDFAPLVASEIFEEVQRITEHSGRVRHSRRRDHPDFPFRRVLRCSRCGAAMTASTSTARNGRGYGYYRCTHGCPGGIRADRVEDLFGDYLFPLCVRPDLSKLFAAVTEDARHQRVARAEAVQRHLETQVRNLDLESDRLLDAHLAKRLDQASYDRRRQRIERERADVTSQLERVRATITDSVVALSVANDVLEDPYRYWKQLHPDQKPRFLNALFPTGLTYDAGRIGTTQSPWLLTQWTADSAFGEPWADLATSSWNQSEQTLEEIEEPQGGSS